MEKNLKQDIDEIWRKYKETKDIELRNILIEHYLYIVKIIAERLKSRLPSSVDINDLISVGVLGLIDAIEKFDINKGVKFETFCKLRIKGEMLDELRRIDWMPRLLRIQSNKFEKVYADLSAKLGRPPREDELAKEMGMSPEEFDEFLKEIAFSQMLSIDNPVLVDKEGKVLKIEFVESQKKNDPSYNIKQEELREAIIKELMEEEKLVVVMYYYDELTMKEIGEVLGLTESRICQIHAQILAKLRSKLILWKDEI